MVYRLMIKKIAFEHQEKYIKYIFSQFNKEKAIRI
jgi:ribosomal protein S17E